MRLLEHTKEERRKWVCEKLFNKELTDQVIRKKAGIARSTLNNWVKEFPDVKELGRAYFCEKEPHKIEPKEETFYWKGDYKAKHEILVSAIRHINKRYFNNLLYKAILRANGNDKYYACDILGVKAEEINIRHNKPDIDENIVKDTIANLLRSRRATTLKACKNKLNKGIYKKWRREQIDFVYSKYLTYFKQCKLAGLTLNTRNEKTKVNKNLGINWHIVYFKKEGIYSEYSKADRRCTETIRPIFIYSIFNQESMSPLKIDISNKEYGESDLGLMLTTAMRQSGIPARMHFQTSIFNKIVKWKQKNKIPISKINSDDIEPLEQRLLIHLDLKDKANEFKAVKKNSSDYVEMYK